MPEQPDETVPRDGDQPSEVEQNRADEVERERESEAEPAAEAAGSADPGLQKAHVDATETDSDASADAERRARLEAAKRRYRATLRNEAESGGGGFSEDYYRSQKPPHWS
jgi:hypothetical protein